MFGALRHANNLYDILGNHYNKIKYMKLKVHKYMYHLFFFSEKKLN